MAALYYSFMDSGVIFFLRQTNYFEQILCSFSSPLVYKGPGEQGDLAPQPENAPESNNLFCFNYYLFL